MRKEALILMYRQRGVTLIEIMVVIAVVAVLAIMSSAGMGIARERASVAKARNDIDSISKAMGLLSIDTGEWPGHQAGDRAVSEPSNAEICGDGCATEIDGPVAGLMETDGAYTNWTGPYINLIPLDPWGRTYFIDTSYAVQNGSEAPCDGGVIPADCHYVAVVGSYGPDGSGRDLYNGDDVVKVIAQ